MSGTLNRPTFPSSPEIAAAEKLVTAAALGAAVRARARREPQPSLAAVLRASARALRPAIASPEALGRLYAAFDSLPGSLSCLAGIEIRLDADGTVDQIVHVDAAGRDVMLAVSPAALVEHGSAFATWNRIRALCEAWATPGSLAAGVIDHLWFEFDLDRAAVVVPGVFICFGDVPVPGVTRAALRGRSLDAITLLADHDDAPALRVRVGACIDMLPDGAHLPAVATMYGRAKGVVRLCASRVATASLGDLLGRLGWDEPYGGLDELLGAISARQLPGLRDGVVLHLDIDAHGVNRVGLELSFQRSAQFFGAFPEIGALDVLVERGLCLATKRDALLHWPGTEVVQLPGEAGERVVVRRINHVKLTCVRGRPPAAKVYFALMHVPRGAFRPERPGAMDVTPSRRGSNLSATSAV